MQILERDGRGRDRATGAETQRQGETPEGRARETKIKREKDREKEIRKRGEEGGERKEGSWMNEASQEDQEP